MQSALLSAARAEELGLGADRIILSAKVSAVQDLVSVYTKLAARSALRAARRPHRGRHGLQGHRRLHRRHRPLAAGGHRRHHPRLADAGARRRPHARGAGRPGDPAEHGAEVVRAGGRRLPGLRAHHLHRLPGARARRAGHDPRPHARVAPALSRRRDDEPRGHGLHRERPRRIQAGRHRHLAAGDGRGSRRAGVYRRARRR